MDGIPRVHDSPEKTKFMSSVDVFQTDSGDWIQQTTSGIPPMGVSGYCCTAVGDSIYYFGGWCGHPGCYHNSVHKLSTLSLDWTIVSPSMSMSGPPMKKMNSGMVTFRDAGEEDFLCVVAGRGSAPLSRQPGSQYKAVLGNVVWCNEHHTFSLSTSELLCTCSWKYYSVMFLFKVLLFY